MAEELGIELLLVPGLSRPWRCTAAGRCEETLRGLRGDALLAVPRGWAPGAGAAARRRLLHVHGARFTRLSPFLPGFAIKASKLAAATSAPVLVHDYPLTPAGTWRDALLDTLAAARWLLACERGCAGGGREAGAWGGSSPPRPVSLAVLCFVWRSPTWSAHLPASRHAGDGRIGGDVCRPGDCAAAARRAQQAPHGLAAEAPGFEQLLGCEGA